MADVVGNVGVENGNNRGRLNNNNNNNHAMPVRGGPTSSSSVHLSLFSRFGSWMITFASFLLTSLVIFNAYVQREQFYPSVVYLTKSNPSMAVIYLQSLIIVYLVSKLMKKLFFGQLRAAEFEHLVERSWYAVTETCLAFTVFKDDFSPKFVALFTILLFLKGFHWLCEERVDFMERSTSITWLFHLRILSLNLLLASLDANFILYAFNATLNRGPSVQLVFGFEYAILLTLVTTTVLKYVLHCIDLMSDNPWENKAVYLLYGEVVIGLVKVILYGLFITIMMRIFTLPLFALRPMYLTLRGFKKALNDIILSRRAIHNMDTWYPDATAEELANNDNVCIICREEMTEPSATKKLPCNHIFHKSCLRSWFQRQQTCPTCRLDVLTATNQQQRQQRTQQQQQGRAGEQPGAVNNGVPVPPPPPPQFDPQWVNQMMAAAARGRPPPPPPPTSTSTTASYATSTTTGTTTATTTSSSAPSSSMPPPQFPFLPPPPFGLLPPPLNLPPPPLPPPDFRGLTDAELAAMEGRERSHVEARIRCLRNVQLLLDAAMLEMQQYSNVAARLNLNSATSFVSTAVTSDSAVTTTTTTTAASRPVTSTTASMGAIPKTRPSAEPKTTSVDQTKTAKDGSTKTVDAAATEDNNTRTESMMNNERDENDVASHLRRRRLEKFQQETNNTE